MSEDLELHQLVEDCHYEDTHSWYTCTRKRFNCPFLGIFLATLSSFFFSLCSVIVKGLVDINPIELASFRFAGVLFPTIPIVLYCKQPFFPPGKRIILILRCFMGTSGLMLSFYAFRHMPLADASVIIFSTPVFVAIFARVFLKEPCSYFNVLTIILTLVGVVLITRPALFFSNTLSNEHIDANKYDIWGPVAAIAATLFGANVYILLRALKELHFSVIMVNFGAFALVYTLLICVCIGDMKWPNGRDRWLVLVLGIFSFFGQILLTISLQIEQAGPVAIARCVDIVFAFIWQMIFFGEMPNKYSTIGAFLVVSSVVLTALRKWTLTLPTDSRARKRLQILMMD